MPAAAESTRKPKPTPQAPAISLPVVDPTFGTLDTDDRAVWAQGIIDSQTVLGKGVPERVDLETAITDVEIRDMMQGSSAIILKVADPEWELLDSGFFGVDEQGNLDPIDVNYPDGSDYWWRSMQISNDLLGNITLTFMERAAAFLADHKGPIKASRAKVTRAEFLKSLADQVKAGGGVNFHSNELHQKQPKAPQQDSKARSSKAKRLNQGSSHGLTVKGTPITSKQTDNANILLDACSAHNASEKVMEAIIYAAMGESNLVYESGASQGVLQTQAPHYNNGHDTKAQAEGWLTGGPDFQAGGGIKAARTYHQVWQIANAVEANAVWIASKGDSYGHQFPGGQKAGLAEAKKIVQSYGGASGSGSGTYTKQYNFQVGTTNDPNEDFWAAMQRLAQEVNWALFLDGRDLYYDAETNLITQEPAATLQRGDPVIVTGQFDWDSRNIATQVQIDVVCDPFEFRAGEVFLLQDLGPCSDGSVAKLPGRWLIAESVRRPMSTVATTFTLKQPLKPKPEPASTTGTKHSGAGGGAGGSGKGSGGMINPFKNVKNLGASRVDEGCDYTGDGDIVAPCKCKVFHTETNGSWWASNGGGFVGITLLEGDRKDEHMYFAEQVTPKCHVGQTLEQGKVIAHMHSPSMEAGWAAGSGPEPYAYRKGGGYSPDGRRTAAGVNFNELMVSLGAPKCHPDTGSAGKLSVQGHYP